MNIKCSGLEIIQVSVVLGYWFLGSGLNNLSCKTGEWHINDDTTAYWRIDRRNCIDICTSTRADWGCKWYVLRRFDLHFKQFGENKLVILGGNLSVYVVKGPNDYNWIHEGFGHGGRNLEADRILEMGSALDMIVSNTFFEKQDTRLITWTQVLPKLRLII